MYDDAGLQYFAIGGELRPARVRDDVYLHIEAGTAPTCPDCAATGAAMKMRRCTPPPGAYGLIHGPVGDPIQLWWTYSVLWFAFILRSCHS